MTLPVSEQMRIFLTMLLTGAAGGVLFDFFRAVRRAMGYDKKITDALDILFWIIFTAAMFAINFDINNGRLRWYEFFAAGLGAIVYFFTVSPLVRTVLLWIVTLIIKIIILFCKIILTPLLFLYKIIMRLCRFTARKAKRPCRGLNRIFRNFYIRILRKIKKAFLFWKKT